MMRIIIAGGTGQIGGRLAGLLAREGNEVRVLTRSERRASAANGIEYAHWNGESLTGWEKLVDGADAVINLAGENIGGKPWSDEQLERITRSRTAAGNALVEAIRQASRRPAVLIQASAVGYYGTERKTALDETSGPGKDALAEICVQWESSTMEVESMGVRRIIIRTGLVLEKDQGVLPRMMLPFRFFAGGPLGNGEQVLSWIHLEDELAALIFLLKNTTANGPYNLTAPAPATNREFGRTLAGVMKKPFWLPVPAFALKILLRRQSKLVLEGQQVLPKRLLEAGFSFKHPELKAALQEIIG
jgi:uncharacterized protein (TIGR01777 family)